MLVTWGGVEVGGGVHIFDDVTAAELSKHLNRKIKRKEEEERKEKNKRKN